MEIRDNKDPEIFIEIYNSIKSIKNDLNVKLGRSYNVEIYDIELENVENIIDPDRRWIDKFYSVDFLIVNLKTSLRMTFKTKIDVNKILYSYYKNMIITDLIERTIENEM